MDLTSPESQPKSRSVTAGDLRQVNNYGTHAWHGSIICRQVSQSKKDNRIIQATATLACDISTNA